MHPTPPIMPLAHIGRARLARCIFLFSIFLIGPTPLAFGQDVAPDDLEEQASG